MRPFGLRWRLLSTIAVVATLTLLLAGSVLRRAVHRQIEVDTLVAPVDARDLVERLNTAGQRLVAFHTRDGWTAVEAELEAVAAELGDGHHVLLFDAVGSFLASSLGVPIVARLVPSEEAGQPDEIEIELTAADGHLETTRWVTPSSELVDATGRRLGRLHLLPPDSEELVNNRVDAELGDVRGRLVAGLDRWLWVCLGGALWLTLIATWWLSRRLLRPLEALTQGVRRIADGELHQEIEVQGDDEVADLAMAFNAMARSLRRTEALRQQVVHDVAHELRTPLTRLRAQLETVLDGLAPASTERLRALHDDTLLLGGLIHDLDELARAEAGQLRLDIETIDVGEVVRSAVRAMAALPGAVIEVDVADGDVVARADGQRTRQMVDNLLTNARTHTPVDGVIRVLARYRGHQVEVVVEDTGTGLDEEAKSRVFERFYRVDPSRTRATGGAGLGLAIVAQLADLQGGRVSVESRLGEGSRFAFFLPRAAVSQLVHE